MYHTHTAHSCCHSDCCHTPYTHTHVPTRYSWVSPPLPGFCHTAFTHRCRYTCHPLLIPSYTTPCHHITLYTTPLPHRHAHTHTTTTHCFAFTRTYTVALRTHFTHGYVYVSPRFAIAHHVLTWLCGLRFGVPTHRSPLTTYGSAFVPGHTHTCGLRVLPLRPRCAILFTLPAGICRSLRYSTTVTIYLPHIHTLVPHRRVAIRFTAYGSATHAGPPRLPHTPSYPSFGCTLLTQVGAHTTMQVHTCHCLPPAHWHTVHRWPAVATIPPHLYLPHTYHTPCPATHCHPCLPTPVLYTPAHHHLAPFCACTLRHQRLYTNRRAALPHACLPGSHYHLMPCHRIWFRHRTASFAACLPPARCTMHSGHTAHSPRTTLRMPRPTAVRAPVYHLFFGGCWLYAPPRVHLRLPACVYHGHRHRAYCRLYCLCLPATACRYTCRAATTAFCLLPAATTCCLTCGCLPPAQRHALPHTYALPPDYAQFTTHTQFFTTHIHHLNTPLPLQLPVPATPHFATFYAARPTGFATARHTTLHLPATAFPTTLPMPSLPACAHCLPHHLPWPGWFA